MTESSREIEKGDLFKDAMELALYVILLIIILCCIKTMFFEIAVVKGTSMNDTLQDGDMLLVNVKAFRRYDEDCFSYGDILIVRYPDRKERFIKRLVGKPGDKIEIKDGTLYRNDEPVEEDYIKGYMKGTYGPFYIDDEHYFVLGDNRNNSNDSRSVGSLPWDYIVGKAEFRFYPFRSFTRF